MKWLICILIVPPIAWMAVCAYHLTHHKTITGSSIVWPDAVNWTNVQPSLVIHGALNELDESNHFTGSLMPSSNLHRWEFDDAPIKMFSTSDGSDKLEMIYELGHIAPDSRATENYSVATNNYLLSKFQPVIVGRDTNGMWVIHFKP